MFSEFFINRPIFAAVIAIIITLAGLIASQVLPVAQYPEIAPHDVITASYPRERRDAGATVAAPIEEQLSGVENLIYSARRRDRPHADDQLHVEVGSKPQGGDHVINRVAIVLRDCPTSCGDVAQKRSTDILPVIALGSNDPRHDTLYLNYATINPLDESKRIRGSPTRQSSVRAITRCKCG